MLLDSTGNPYPSSLLRGSYGGSAHFAAQPSEARSELLLFGKDTREMLTPWSHTTLMLKSRTLFENSGNARLPATMAILLGWLSPQADSGDAKWDEQGEERFHALAMNPLTFDAAGRLDFRSAQISLPERAFVDGDIFSLALKTEEGAPQVAFREAHQCCNDYGDWRGDWRMGVRTDRNGRPLEYRFCDPAYPREEYKVPAAAVHHMMNKSALGAVRGTPVLAHCITDLHDVIETKAFQKLAIKIAAQMGLARKAEPQNQFGNLNGLSQPVVAEEMYAVDDAGETVKTGVQHVESVMGGGIVSQTPLEAVHDDRPHPNWQAFVDSLLREAARGAGLPPQIAFFMDDPGGAWNRTLLDYLARWIVDRITRHTRPWCQWVWNHFIGTEIAAGRLRAPAGAKSKFWKVRWVPQRSMTADLGRMGKLAIDFRRALMTTYAQHYEELGMDGYEQMRQCAKEARDLIDLEKEFDLPSGLLLNALLPPNAAAAGPGGEEEDRPQ